MSATIRHSCGHTEHHPSKHGHFEPETVRFMANSLCTRCSDAAADRYQWPNPYRPGHVSTASVKQFAVQRARELIAAGLKSVTVTDTHTGQTFEVTA